MIKQIRLEQTQLDKTEQDWTGLDKTGQDWTRLDILEEDWTGLEKTSMLAILTEGQTQLANL